MYIYKNKKRGKKKCIGSLWTVGKRNILGQHHECWPSPLSCWEKVLIFSWVNWSSVFCCIMFCDHQYKCQAQETKLYFICGSYAPATRLSIHLLNKSESIILSQCNYATVNQFYIPETLLIHFFLGTGTGTNCKDKSFKNVNNRQTILH